MERTGLVALLVVALLAGPQFAAGKGAPVAISTGKSGGDVNVDVQCTQACKDECIPVPNKVCNDVPYQQQVCNKVAVQMTKKVCDRVCTQTQTYTETVSSGKGKGGMPITTIGKGRRMFSADGLIKGKAAAVMAIAPTVYGQGKGIAAPAVDVNCQDVCNDVPYTTYQTQCNTVTQTKQVCDIVYQQQCNQVCKPVCQKITTVTTTTTQSLGKGLPVLAGKGRH